MMKSVDLDNVSYAAFLQFEADKFEYYKRIGLLLAHDSGGLNEITVWTYGKVKEMQMKFTQDILFKEIPGILAFCHESEPAKFFEKKWHEVFGLYNHIVSENQVIIEREKILSYEPDADQVEAGIERFQSFGVLTTIDDLADGNVLLYDEIEAKPYYLIFAKLHLESVKRQYNMNLTKIHQRKKR